MFEFFNDVLSGDETAIFQLAHSIFLIIVFLTVLFLFVLFQQKNLDQLYYSQEYINKSYVNVLYSNNWGEEELPVLLIIPGNPGQAGFYLEYMNLVVEESNDAYRACTISHVGQSPASDKIFNVKDQVESKLQFITSKLEPGTSITLIAHSFGAYVALKLLEKGIKIEKAILLMPLLDNMALMPKSENLKTMLNYESYIIGIAWLTGLLPRQLKERMIQFYSGKFSKNIQDHLSATISELINYKVLKCVFGLAQNELAVIKDPDFKLIKKFQDKLVFYYGMHDLWAPLDCLRKLRKAVPGINFHIADDDILHTFMFNSCHKVAVKTVEFLTQDTRYDINNLIPNYAMVAEARKHDEDYDFCEEEKSN